jgi:hypothetical protein
MKWCIKMREGGYFCGFGKEGVVYCDGSQVNAVRWGYAEQAWRLAGPLGGRVVCLKPKSAPLAGTGEKP